MDQRSKADFYQKINWGGVLPVAWLFMLSFCLFCFWLIIELIMYLV